MGYAPHPSPSGDTFPRGGRLYQRLKTFFALLSIARKSEKGKAFCKELNLQVKTPEIDQVF